jgi:hypothetical protein
MNNKILSMSLLSILVLFPSTVDQAHATGTKKCIGAHLGDANNCKQCVRFTKTHIDKTGSLGVQNFEYFHDIYVPTQTDLPNGTKPKPCTEYHRQLSLKHFERRRIKEFDGMSYEQIKQKLGFPKYEGICELFAESDYTMIYTDRKLSLFFSKGICIGGLKWKRSTDGKRWLISASAAHQQFD